MALPLSASDLHAIADALDKIELVIASDPILGDIDVLRPEGDKRDYDVVGKFVKEGDGDDAWYGFEVKERG